MEFNMSKCEVLYFGRSNVMAEYAISGTIFNNIDVQRDLGVQVHNSLKVATQVDRSGH